MGRRRGLRARLRVVDVIPKHVEGVVHAGPEVETVQVLGELLPPAHIQQAGDELVKALQLCSGGGREKEGEGEMVCYKSQFKVQG